MTERPDPDLDRVREAMRKHDERETQDDDDVQPDREDDEEDGENAE
jgi:hypothetical protein